MVKMSNPWWFGGQPFTAEMIGDHVGFVYLIENIETGKKYIGKKFFKSLKTKKPLKGRVNKRRTKVASDWEDYYGSNKELKADVEKYGKDKFKRDILKLCKSKGTTNYYEMLHQIENRVLEQSNWYNDWIFVKVHRSQIKE
jgi:hypothetical protein